MFLFVNDLQMNGSNFISTELNTSPTDQWLIYCHWLILRVTLWEQEDIEFCGFKFGFLWNTAARVETS